jgi:hypothetical protein
MYFSKASKDKLAIRLRFVKITACKRLDRFLTIAMS